MSYLADKRTEHEHACEEAVRRKDFARATFRAAKTAEFSLRLAEVTDGKVARRYVEDAFEWIRIGEQLASRRAETAVPLTARLQASGPNCSKPQTISEAPQQEAPSEWLVTETPNVSLDDIAGMSEVKQLIRDMILDPLRNPELAAKWGVAKGGGVLMFGPPGNGKTTIAKAIAHELDCPFFLATGADIRSKWSGEAEKHLRQLVREAKSHSTSVLFIDDLDGLLPRRGGYSVVDNRVVCQFLNEIGGFEPAKNALLLLGATNCPWEVDEAVFRTGRFDEKLFVSLPDSVAREQILRRYLAGTPISADVDLQTVADHLEGYTGSDLAGIAASCKRAGFRREISGQDDTVMTLADIEEAVRRIPKSVTSEMMQRYKKFSKQRYSV